MGDLNIGAQKLQQIKMAGGFSKLNTRAMASSRKRQQLMKWCGGPKIVWRRSAAAAALMTHAKVTYVKSLLEQLNQTDSGFYKRGYTFCRRRPGASKDCDRRLYNWRARVSAGVV